MDKKIDLTEGGIVEKLVKIAIPIMATSFIQIAYNLIDMMWVRRLRQSNRSKLLKSYLG